MNNEEPLKIPDFLRRPDCVADERRKSASVSNALVSQQQPPVCHFTPMQFEWADDGCQQVEFWICQHCGHTKEMDRYLAG